MTLFLLIVFSMSGLVGFACSIGIDMGYNAGHHNSKFNKTRCCNDQQKGENSKDDCCANFVTQFNIMDKSVADPPLLNPPVFFLALISTFTSSVTLAPGFEGITKIQSFRRSYFLSDKDVRISIQSFQI